MASELLMVSADTFEIVWSNDCCPKRSSKTNQVAQPTLQNMHNNISQTLSNVTARLVGQFLEVLHFGDRILQQCETES
jgi:hypothetical protein